MRSYIASCFRGAKTAWADLAAAVRALWRIACYGALVCSASAAAQSLASNPWLSVVLVVLFLLTFGFSI